MLRIHGTVKSRIRSQLFSSEIFKSHRNHHHGGRVLFECAGSLIKAATSVIPSRCNLLQQARP